MLPTASVGDLQLRRRRERVASVRLRRARPRGGARGGHAPGPALPHRAAHEGGPGGGRGRPHAVRVPPRAPPREHAAAASDGPGIVEPASPLPQLHPARRPRKVPRAPRDVPLLLLLVRVLRVLAGARGIVVVVRSATAIVEAKLAVRRERRPPVDGGLPRPERAGASVPRAALIALALLSPARRGGDRPGRALGRRRERGGRVGARVGALPPRGRRQPGRDAREHHDRVLDARGATTRARPRTRWGTRSTWVGTSGSATARAATTDGRDRTAATLASRRRRPCTATRGACSVSTRTIPRTRTS